MPKTTSLTRVEENVADLGNFGNEKSCQTKGKRNCTQARASG